MIEIIAGASVALAAIGLATYAVVRLVGISRDEADARVHEAELGADLRIALANLRTQTDRADYEMRRADALDDLLAEIPDGDAAGARARVLARYERAGAARGDGPRPVPAPPDATAVAGVDRDGLLRPGD